MSDPIVSCCGPETTWSPILAIAMASLLCAGCNEPDLEGCEQCVGGCAAASCTFDCQSSSCNDRVITCPPGKPCVLSCDGLDACDTTTVVCPAGFACSVQCEGRDACGDMILQCGTSDCSIQCGTDPAACEGAMVNCGTGSCEAACAGTSQPVMGGCEAAAACTQC